MIVLISQKFKLIFFLFLFTIIFLSCQKFPLTNGDNITEERIFDSIKTLNFKGVYTIYLSTGNKNSIKIYGGENIIPLIKTTLFNDSLLIENTAKGDWLRKYDKIDLYICVKNIKKILLLNSCKLVSLDTLNLERLFLIGAAPLSEIDLTFKSFYLVYISSYNNYSSVKFTGKSTIAEFKSHNGCTIDASLLQVNQLYFSHYGIANQKVWVTDEINVNLLNEGNIVYKGDPKIKIFNMSSTGKMIKE